MFWMQNLDVFTGKKLTIQTQKRRQLTAQSVYVVLVFLLLTLNIFFDAYEHIFNANFESVSTVDFEQVNVKLEHNQHNLHYFNTMFYFC